MLFSSVFYYILKNEIFYSYCNHAYLKSQKTHLKRIDFLIDHICYEIRTDIYLSFIRSDETRISIGPYHVFREEYFLPQTFE